MSNFYTISTSQIAKGLTDVANSLPDVPGSPKNLIYLAADRLISQQSNLISCYRKIAERESLEYSDKTHGDEIKP